MTEGTPKDGIRFHVQGPSSVVDAATSSVARETAVSFSPPPQRALPSPSNDPRKIKEKAAEFGDDGDDDFVGVPPGPSASFSKATRVAAPKIKNSKPALPGRKHSENVSCFYLAFPFGMVHLCCCVCEAARSWHLCNSGQSILVLLNV